MTYARNVNHRAMPLASVAALALAGALCLSYPTVGFAVRPGVRLPSGTVPQLRAIRAGDVTVNPTVPSGTGQRLVIDQRSQQAMLDWNSFNIGPASEVRFNQPATTAEALNRIFDADPTIIQGKLSANGRLYLINQNGIVFDRGSQVDVRGLIASSLAISDSTFNEGVFFRRAPGVPVAEGADSAIDGGAGVMLLDIEGRPLRNDVVNYGTIRAVNPDTGSPDTGGFVMLFGPRVENRGSITAQNGQVVLAAGERVFIRPNLVGGGAIDPSMRGMVVEVAAGSSPVNITELVASNFGSIQANRGNVTLAGLAVNQMGRISAGTAVTQNGSVWLVAGARAVNAPDGAEQAGKVRLGAGSVTETPLLDDGATVAEGDAYVPAEVRIQAHDVTHAGSIVSHGGRVEIGPIEAEAGLRREGRVFLAGGSLIDVSGNWAEVPYDKNFASFRVGTNDLRDAPLQKGGTLFGRQLGVDLRRANPALFDLGEFREAVRRGILEKATGGGSIKVTSGEFVAMPESVVDISGGGYRYSAGRDVTSKVVVDGRIIDIHDAPANRPIQAVIEVFDSVDERVLARWNADRRRRLVVIRDRGDAVLEVIPDEKWLSAPRLVATGLGRLFPSRRGYVEGKPAGSFTADVASGVLAGSLRAGASSGPFQRSSGIAAAGSFTLGQEQGLRVLRDVSLVDTLTELPQGFGEDSELPAGVADRIEISTAMLSGEPDRLGEAEYRREGVGSLRVFALGSIDVAAGTDVSLLPGGSLALDATGVTVAAARIAVPGGSVALTGRDQAAGRPEVRLESGARISTAGQWSNDFQDGAGNEAKPIFVRGGNVTLSAVDTRLEPGSLIDASGGGRVGSDRRVSFGDGGNITLRSVRDELATLGTDANNLHLLGTFQSWSGVRGGSLTLGTNSIRVEGGSSSISSSGSEMSIGAGFFRENGFGNYVLETRTKAEIAAGTAVRPVSQSLTLDLGQAIAAPSGTALSEVAERVLLPLGQRSPASFSMGLSRPERAPAGQLVIAQGSSIETDPAGRITLAATSAGAPTTFTVAGRLSAPAGTVTIASSVNGITAFGGETLRIAEGARIEATGASLLRPSAPERQAGEVLRGGTISIVAARNDLEVESGAVLDVSAAAVEIDLPVMRGGRREIKRTRIDGDAGVVSIAVTEDARIAGTLLGNAQPGKAGGTLTLDTRFHGQSIPSGTLNPDPRLRDDVNHRIVLASGAPAPRSFDGDARRAGVDVSQLVAGGFDKLRFAAQDSIEVASGLDLVAGRALRLDTPEIRAGGAGPVRIAAPVIELHNTPSLDRPSTGFVQNVAGTDTFLRNAVATHRGDASASFSGGRVELAGHLTLSGFARVGIDSAGDIVAGVFPFNSSVSPGQEDFELKTKLGGSLTTPADLTLRGRQVLAASAVGTSLDGLTDGFTFRVADVAGDGSVATKPGGGLTIAGTGGAPSPVFSAGGSLVFEADRLVQAGTIKAPLGRIRLVGRQTLDVAEGSLTSVSAEGMTIPFGSTVNGQSLFYGPADRTGTPPEKRIELAGMEVDVAGGAVLNLSGGGDIQALEFLPGPGGSRDTLVRSDTFAIVPGLDRAPMDSHIALKRDLGTGNANAIHDSIEIAPGSDIPAGVYALLPGQYALLPGAYLIRRQSGAGSRDFVPGSSSRIGGAAIVAARGAVAGTSVRESRWSAYSVQPGSAALLESEYRIAGSDFLAERAIAQDRNVPELARDAGRLAVTPSVNLSFGGEVRGAPAAGGRPGKVDITAERIAVVTHAAGHGETPLVDIETGQRFVELEAETLSRFGTSLLLGGVRSNGSKGEQLEVVSRKILVANDAEHALTGSDLIFAASDELRFAAGSSVVASAARGAVTGDLRVTENSSGSSAVVRLSAGDTGDVLRAAAPDIDSKTRGKLIIENKAVLKSDRSIALDASGETTLAGSLSLPPLGGEVSLAGSRLVIGGSLGEGEGVGRLTAAQISDLSNASRLTLRSYTSLDLVPGTSLGSDSLGTLVLDAPGVSGLGGDGSTTSTVRARSIVLQNRTGQTYSQTPTGRGGLGLEADRVVLGEGSKTIAGFDTVRLTGREEIRGSGSGVFRVAADLSATAGVITGEARSRQEIIARDLGDVWRPVTLSAAPTALRPQAPLGGRLSIAGSSIDQGGTIDLPGGVLSLRAMGDATGNGAPVGDSAALGPGGSLGDGIALRGTSLTRVAGVSRDFADVVASTTGGSVRIATNRGSVLLESGASLDVSAPGEAGNLSVMAPSGSFVVNGQMAGGAGERGGRFALDAGGIADLDGLVERLSAGGFTQRIDLRSRSGDLALGAGRTLSAHEIVLAADGGSIDLKGTVEASGRSGGNVEIWAGRNLRLWDGSVVAARGEAADSDAGAKYGHGGRVWLASTEGTLGLDAGARVDVSAHPEGKSDGGEVVFTARQIGESALNLDLAMNLLGSVSLTGGRTVGATVGSVVLEGTKTYLDRTNTAGAVVATVTNPVYADFKSFLDASARLRAKRPQGAGESATIVRPAIELRNSASMAHDLEWALNVSSGVENWMLGSGAGRVVLRAAGDLDLRSALGFGVGQRPDAYPLGASWSLDLVGGGDLKAANPLVVRTDTEAGDVLFSTNTARVGTGTGNVRIAAGRDVAMNAAGAGAAADLSSGALNSGAAVFTTGARNAADRRFGSNGGSISIAAGQHVLYDREGKLDPAEFPNAWLRRTTSSSTSAILPSTLTVAEWWSEPRLFRRGVATFGGGEIDIRAGADVRGLSAYAATAGQRVLKDGSRGLVVHGGGDLSVMAGGDIAGGYFLAGLGQTTLEAGDTVGTAAQPIAPMVMGWSNDAGRQGADFAVRGRSGIFSLTPVNPTSLPLPGRVNVGNTVQPEFGSALQGRLTQTNQQNRVAFFTYAPSSSFSARATAGDVVVANRPINDALGNNGVFVGRGNTNFGGLTNQRIFQRLDDLEIMPPVVEFVAFDGDVRSPSARTQTSAANRLAVFPSTQQQVDFLAGGTVRDMDIDALDVAPQQLPSPVGTFVSQTYNAAVSNLATLADVNSLNLALRFNGSAVQASRQRLAANAAPGNRFRVVALSGDVADSVFNLWQPASFIAGRDIRNLRLDGQNLAPGDTTLIRAERDVSYTGNTSGGLVLDADSSYIDIGGPGRLVVQAGRNVDLGIARGVLAKGNAANRFLPTDASSRITVLAGLSGEVDLQSIDRMFEQIKAINVDKDLSTGERLARTDALIGSTFAASRLGPGDIDMLFSRLRTDGGGGIDLLAPRGAVNVGLPTPLSDGRELGILTSLGGDIRVHLDGDISVNLSKIVAIQGGEVLIYTRRGDVDAGRGARNSLASLAGDVAAVNVDTVIGNQTVAVDTGLRAVRPPVAAAGSGIRTVSFDPDGAGPVAAPRPGGIFLFAPEGTIDAGEGGVSAAGEIFLSALQVLNASNISSGGAASGVPTVQTGTIAGLAAGASGATAGTSKAIDDVARNSGEAAARSAGANAFKPSIVTVDVLGFGEQGDESKADR